MDLEIISRDKCDAHVIKVGEIEIGGKNLSIIGGPCSIECDNQIGEIAKYLSDLGVKILRGGAFKPRTSPYDFQGLGEDGLKYLREAKERYNMIAISEVMDTRDVEIVSKYVDIFQIGSRNMQNFSLLKEVGRSKLPVLLKRGLAATLEEWLYAAEYIAAEGNMDIILCERGIRTFETCTRNTLDLSSAVVAIFKTCLPVIADPSHGTGRKDLIHPMAMAAIAAGCHGVMIETHTNPDQALSDGHQSITLPDFRHIFKDLIKLHKYIND